MNKISSFFDHVYTAIRHGEWCCGFALWKGKPLVYISLIPCDGWNFFLHIGSFYLCVSYPWCGRL